MFERPTGLSFQAALRDVAASKAKDRLAAADTLANAESDADKKLAHEALLPLLSDVDPHVRIAASFSIADLRQEDAWRSLAPCLEDKHSDVRQKAAIALGNLGDKGAADALIQALQSPHPDLRFQAATSLVEVDAERAFSPLIEALACEEDPEVLGAIALALGAVENPKAADQLAKLLDHSSPRTRLDAAYALSQFGDPRSKETLAAALSSATDGWDAVMALEKLGPSSAEDLRNFLKQERGHIQVRLRAAGALLSLSQHSTQTGLSASPPQEECARRVLFGGLRSRKLEIRGLAVEELGKSAGLWAVEYLQRLAQSFRGRKQRGDIAEAIAAIESRHGQGS